MDQAQIDLKEQARKLFERAQTDPPDIATIYQGAASYPTVDIPSDLKEVEVIVKEASEAPLSKKEVTAIKAAIPILELLIAQRDAAHEKNRADYLSSLQKEMSKRIAAMELMVDESKREAALAREAFSAAQASRETPLVSAIPTAEQMSTGVEAKHLDVHYDLNTRQKNSDISEIKSESKEGDFSELKRVKC
jgi:hypothetical protein